MTDNLHQFTLLTHLSIDLQLIQMIDFLLFEHQYQLTVIQTIRFQDQFLERMLEVFADVLAAEIQGIAVDLQLCDVCEVLEHALC